MAILTVSMPPIELSTRLKTTVQPSLMAVVFAESAANNSPSKLMDTSAARIPRPVVPLNRSGTSRVSLYAGEVSGIDSLS